MKNELLDIIEMVSNEKGISSSAVVELLEDSMSLAITKYLKDPHTKAKVTLDTENFDFDIQGYTLKNPDILSEYDSIGSIDDSEFKQSKINLSKDQLGRIIAISTKKSTFYKINQKEKEEQIKAYLSRVGEIFTVTLKKVLRNSLIVSLDRLVDGIVEKNALLPNENFYKIGARIRMVLDDVVEKDGQYKLFLSRTSQKYLGALLKIEVPEIDQETIEIKGIGREAGYRSKVVVKTNDRRVDPVSACIGIRGSRIQMISSDLNGERVDVVAWDNSAGQLIINLLHPVNVKRMVLDEDTRTFDVIVDEDKLGMAIGRNGVNVNLIRDVSGYKINILSEDEAGLKDKQQLEDTTQFFVGSLEVSESVAQELVQNDFVDIEDIAYAEESEITEAIKISIEEVQRIIKKANEVLEQEQSIEVDKEVLNISGVDHNIAKMLLKNNIKTRDDVAELASDELLEIIPISEGLAKEIIMSAREHWFK